MFHYAKWFFYYRFVFAKRAKNGTGKTASVAKYLSKHYVRPLKIEIITEKTKEGKVFYYDE